MADDYSTFSTLSPRLTAEEEQRLRRHLSTPSDDEFDAWPESRRRDRLFEHHVEDLDEWPGFEFEFGHRANVGQRLWVCAEAIGNVDAAGRVVQAFLERFRPNDRFAPTYATTCSKLRAGEFGGGALFIAADRIERMDSHGWLEAKVLEWSAHGRGRRPSAIPGL